VPDPKGGHIGRHGAFRRGGEQLPGVRIFNPPVDAHKASLRVFLDNSIMVRAGAPPRIRKLIRIEVALSFHRPKHDDAKPQVVAVAAVVRNEARY